MKFLNKAVVFACLCLPFYGFCQVTDGNSPSAIVPANADTKSCCSGGGCCCKGGLTPIGIMTDHVHPKGEWMVSYSYMDMNMKGNRRGATPASDEAVYKTYDMSPETMQMQMQMVMVMYGLTDKLTLMAMGGFTSNYMTMNMNTSMNMMPGMVMPGASMTQGMSSVSNGLSDTRVYGLYSLKQTGTGRLVGSLGFNLPTGSISNTGLNMFTETNERLAYMMQTGTGSYSLLPSLTFVHSVHKFSLGAEGGADVKLNYNQAGYRWGNVYNATVWAAYPVCSFISASLRAEGINAGKISGSDKGIINPNASGNIEFDPTADPRNSGGTWVNAYAGLNLHINKPVLKNFTAQCEYGLPVYQNLNGTQMALSSNILVGVGCKF